MLDSLSSVTVLLPSLLAYGLHTNACDVMDAMFLSRVSLAFSKRETDIRTSLFYSDGEPTLFLSTQYYF